MLKKILNLPCIWLVLEFCSQQFSNFLNRFLEFTDLKVGLLDYFGFLFPVTSKFLRSSPKI